MFYYYGNEVGLLFVGLGFSGRWESRVFMLCMCVDEWSCGRASRVGLVYVYVGVGWFVCCCVGVNYYGFVFVFGDLYERVFVCVYVWLVWFWFRFVVFICLWFGLLVVSFGCLLWVLEI